MNRVQERGSLMASIIGPAIGRSLLVLPFAGLAVSAVGPGGSTRLVFDLNTQVKLPACDLGVPAFPTFGTQVACDGDVIAVSSMDDDFSFAEPGVVCIYEQERVACCSLVAPDQGPFFGRSLALQGDELFVGSKSSVHVYRRMAEGVWIVSEVLEVPDMLRIDVDGNRLAVTSCDAARGVVLFERSAGGKWLEAASIPLPRTMSCFMAISLEEDLLLVEGSPAHSGIDDAVFVYLCTRDGWVQDGILQPPSYSVLDFEFGQRLQLWRGAAYVCDQTNSPTKGIPDTGVVFVYERRESGEWELESELTPRQGTRFEGFGGAIAINENGMFVGAPRRDSRVADEAGSVYQFRRTRPREQWQQVGRVFACDPQSGASFGWSVAESDGVLVVGAPYADAQGAAYRIDVGE